MPYKFNPITGQFDIFETKAPQTLSFDNGTLQISDGNSVDVSSYIDQATLDTSLEAANIIQALISGQSLVIPGPYQTEAWATRGGIRYLQPWIGSGAVQINMDVDALDVPLPVINPITPSPSGFTISGTAVVGNTMFIIVGNGSIALTNAIATEQARLFDTQWDDRVLNPTNLATANQVTVNGAGNWSIAITDAEAEAVIAAGTIYGYQRNAGLAPSLPPVEASL